MGDELRHALLYWIAQAEPELQTPCNALSAMETAIVGLPIIRQSKTRKYFLVAAILTRPLIHDAG